MATASAERPQTLDPGWFASWFDSVHYHMLYAHRDAREAAGLIDALVDCLRPADGSTMLDLGCGAGRHSRHLAAKGFGVTGLDLSAASIAKARQFSRAGLQFRRHDMRVPFGTDAFDYVFNLFTSFGYFTEPAEHLLVVQNVARSLRTGGQLVLDYVNVRHAEAHLVRREAVERDGIRYDISRWTDAGHIFKRIAIHDPARRAPIEYVEQVAKFGVHHFELLFELSGLQLEQIYGDDRLAPFDIATSPRLILVARKTGGHPAALPPRQGRHAFDHYTKTGRPRSSCRIIAAAAVGGARQPRAAAAPRDRVLPWRYRRGAAVGSSRSAPLRRDRSWYGPQGRRGHACGRRSSTCSASTSRCSRRR